MWCSALVYILCAFGGFCKALSAEIQTQPTVMAAVGEEAYLNCQLMQTRDVLQVTWQKISPEREENLATCNKFFGQRVSPDFRDKVEFKEAGLQNSSIVIRKVSEQDEGCYRCLFNTYPDGAITGSTCLQLYELHEPVLRVGESDCAEEAVVSCSATGRPAPTVTLNVLRQDLHLSNHSSVSITNANGTATVTATAVLPRLRDNNTQVGCAAQVLSGPQIEVFMTVPEVKQLSAKGFDEESESNDSSSWIALPLVVTCVAAAAAVIIFWLKRKKQNSLSHRVPNEIVQSTINDLCMTQVLVTQDKDELRQRSPVMVQPNVSPLMSRTPCD
ncbi:OX-2 membrane glycoprotein-like isoform X1 [Pempheris klunzingeri]|uniref:OX-2 membrane glycoprotein-like isoform X1 n=2 Tax=Pempheris klunzingeri TaxID=3127111 RepID=UPI00397FF27F